MSGTASTLRGHRKVEFGLIFVLVALALVALIARAIVKELNAQRATQKEADARSTRLQFSNFKIQQLSAPNAFEMSWFAYMEGGKIFTPEMKFESRTEDSVTSDGRRIISEIFDTIRQKRALKIREIKSTGGSDYSVSMELDKEVIPPLPSEVSYFYLGLIFLDIFAPNFGEAKSRAMQFAHSYDSYSFDWH